MLPACCVAIVAVLMPQLCQATATAVSTRSGAASTALYRHVVGVLQARSVESQPYGLMMCLLPLQVMTLL